MTREDVIELLQTILDALKKDNEDDSIEPVSTTVEEPKPIQIPVEQPPVPVQMPQPLQSSLQVPATNWDILKQNQQQLALLQQEISNLKMASAAGMHMPIGQYGLQPMINPNNIGGNIQ